MSSSCLTSVASLKWHYFPAVNHCMIPNSLFFAVEFSTLKITIPSLHNTFFSNPGRKNFPRKNNPGKCRGRFLRRHIWHIGSHRKTSDWIIFKPFYVNSSNTKPKKIKNAFNFTTFNKIRLRENSTESIKSEPFIRKHRKQWLEYKNSQENRKMRHTFTDISTDDPYLHTRSVSTN